MPRQYTEKEVRDNLLRYLRFTVAKHWAETDRCETILERIEGAIFTTLSALDGESSVLPAFIVAPYPCAEDRDICVENKENWYPENNRAEITCDLGGLLHDNFYQVEEETENEQGSR